MIALLEAMLADSAAIAGARAEGAKLQAESAQLRHLTEQISYYRGNADKIGAANDRLRNIVSQISALEKAGKIDGRSLANIHSLMADIGVTVRSRPTPTVTRFLEQTFISEKCLEADTLRHVENYVRLFALVTGDKPLNSYARTDVTAWIRFLERLKPSYARGKPISGLSKERILKDSAGADRTLSRTTIEKHITHLKGFFRAAIKHHRFATVDEIDDLFEGARLSKCVPEAQSRKSWSIEQLNALFASPTWSGTRSRREDLRKRYEAGPQIHMDGYWWLPPCSLLLGARLEELAQLHHEDLQYDSGGIAYLRIHEGGDRRVKNKNSIRNVPIHPLLGELGFHSLFQKGAKGRIFPELKPRGRPPKLGGLYTQHFTVYRKELEIYEELRDFHSLRRTFVTNMRHKAKVDIFTIAAIVGHHADDPSWLKLQQTDDYTDYSIQDLYDAVIRLDYERLGLDVSMLRRAAAACGPNGSGRLEQVRNRDMSVDHAA